MRSDDMVGIEVPWLSTMREDGNLHLAKSDDYRTWVKGEYGVGEQAMIIVVPLSDEAFHAAAFRYYQGCVLPMIARHQGEANPERTHANLVGMFLPAVLSLSKRGVVKFRRRSTSMLAMPCAVFCDYIDRVIAWAEDPDELNLRIPMADRAWKWKQEQARRGARENRAGMEAPREDRSSRGDVGNLAGTEPVAASGTGE